MEALLLDEGSDDSLSDEENVVNGNHKVAGDVAVSAGSTAPSSGNTNVLLPSTTAAAGSSSVSKGGSSSSSIAMQGTSSSLASSASASLLAKPTSAGIKSPLETTPLHSSKQHPPTNASSHAGTNFSTNLHPSSSMGAKPTAAPVPPLPQRPPPHHPQQQQQYTVTGKGNLTSMGSPPNVLHTGSNTGMGQQQQQQQIHHPMLQPQPEMKAHNRSSRHQPKQQPKPTYYTHAQLQPQPGPGPGPGPPAHQQIPSSSQHIHHPSQKQLQQPNGPIGSTRGVPAAPPLGTVTTSGSNLPNNDDLFNFDFNIEPTPLAEVKARYSNQPVGPTSTTNTMNMSTLATTQPYHHLQQPQHPQQRAATNAPLPLNKGSNIRTTSAMQMIGSPLVANSTTTQSQQQSGMPSAALPLRTQQSTVSTSSTGPSSSISTTAAVMKAAVSASASTLTARGGGGAGGSGKSELERQKEKFLMLTTVLMKYLEKKDPAMHVQARNVLKNYAKNQTVASGYESLTSVMKTQLRQTVGEIYWKKSEALLLHILKQKKSGATSSSGQQQQQQQQQPYPPHQQQQQVLSNTAVGVSTSSNVRPSNMPPPQQQLQQQKPPPQQPLKQHLPILTKEQQQQQQKQQQAHATATSLKMVEEQKRNVAAAAAAAATTTAKQKGVAMPPPSLSSAGAVVPPTAIGATGVSSIVMNKAPNAIAGSVADPAYQKVPTGAPSGVVSAPGGMIPPQTTPAGMMPPGQTTPASTVPTPKAPKATKKRPPKKKPTAVAAVAVAPASIGTNDATKVTQLTKKGATTPSTGPKKLDDTKQKQQVVAPPHAATVVAAPSITIGNKKVIHPAASAPNSAQVQKPQQLPTRVYEEWMEEVDHAVSYDWTTAMNLLSKENLTDLDLQEEQMKLLHNFVGVGQNLLQKRLMPSGVGPSSSSPDTSPAVATESWSKRNIISSRTAWALIRLPEQEANMRPDPSSHLSKASPLNMAAPTRLNSKESSALLAEPSSAASYSSRVNDDKWYNEEKAEATDPTLFLISEATQSYVRNILEKAVTASRRRCNLAGMRLWHAQHTYAAKRTPPPLALRLGCNVRRQIALANGTAAKISERLEEALARRHNSRKRKYEDDSDEESLLAVTFQEASSMGDLSKRLFTKNDAEEKRIEAANHAAHFFAEYGGKFAGEPPFGKVPTENISLTLSDIMSCVGNLLTTTTKSASNSAVQKRRLIHSAATRRYLQN